MNLIDIIRDYPDELTCIKYLEKMRWPDGVRCLKKECGSDQVTFMTTHSKPNKKGVQKTRYIYQCKTCRYQFTPTVGTLFNDTHLPIRTWFIGITLMADAKKGLSALQMKRHLKIGSYRTAWYLCHRIRKAMEEGIAGLFTGAVEADETFIGGKYDRRRARQKYDKEPVFGIVERGGKVKTWHIPQVTRYHVTPKLEGHISNEAKLYTDQGRMYKRLPKNIEHHEIVDHSAKEWVRGDCHTGTIDGYWGLLKRGIIGSFHQVSIKHLNRYLSEFEYRWNHAQDDLFSLIVIRLLIESAMEYKQLIAPVVTEPNTGPEVSIDDEPF